MMKSWHVIVLEDHKKVIFDKICINVKQSKEVFNECVEKYPPPKYKVLRELY